MTSKYTYVDCRSLHNGVWFNYCKCIHCLRYSRSIILYHMPGLVNKGNSTPNEDKNKKKRSMLNFCWPFSKLDKNSLIYESSKIEIIKLLRDIISINDHKVQSERTVQNRALPLCTCSTMHGCERNQRETSFLWTNGWYTCTNLNTNQLQVKS